MTDFQKAEEILDTIHKLERANAVTLIASHLSQTWAEGFTAGVRNATETQSRILDRLFKPNPNREVQRDRNEERQHGWSVGG